MITPSVSSRRAFTLIELLVVISIIAILATLLFPAVSSALYQAKKTQARNDAAQIALAINAYYNEYGKYPVPGGTAGAADYTSPDNDNSAVMDILSPQNPAPTADNPRGINFLEIPNSTTGKNGRKGGAGPYFDPWGKAYFIAMDTSYDDTITDPSGNGNIRKGALVWSKGDQLGHVSDYNNPAKWLKSWE